MLGFFEFEVFPYKVLFKSIRTHILTPSELKIGDNSSVPESKKLIYDALREGRCFVSNFYHGNAAGFRFYAADGAREYQMGEEIEFNPNLALKWEIPEKDIKCRIIKNGVKIAENEVFKGDLNLDSPGIYRMEVYLRNNAWIFSNHIRIH